MITLLLTSFIALKSVPITITAVVGGKPAGDVVIWLKGAGKGSAGRFNIVQKDKKFEPRILVVPAGSTVGFPNRDDIFHNVFAEYNAKKFDLGMYPKGQTRSVVFDKSGIVSVLCNVHSSMSAYVVVVDSGHYGKTDGHGSLTLTGVPTGNYEVQAWHESGAKASEKLIVSGAPLSSTLILKK